MTIILMIGSFIYGTILSSFYNLVSYRVPKKESIVRPGSHCGNCGTELKMLDLVPVLSCLFNKGRCRYCKEYYGIMHSILEFYIGVLFALSSLLIISENVYIFIIMLLVITLYNLNRVSKDIHGKILVKTTVIIILIIQFLLLLNMNLLMFLIINISLILLMFFVNVSWKVKIGKLKLGFEDVYILLLILIFIW